MGKRDKLIERFLSVPSDFTWNELVKLLSQYGYTEFNKGKTAGSRRKFADENNNIILLHEPHPAKVVKKYAIRQILENLKEKGKIK
ncbi:MAG TPA: type II toxin-antitoxin system HicA family toxin [Chitinophagaceae bacterium]|nr:type II toxin-antitoxin system HicA family toxin [Chitinophagaceae bacterium]MCC6635587.1 type II toxin-antitoxin system HicA family toxin [Chitinophagaceae bacterium]HNL82125.1 type II toxin-antitoxin system HicA family toxin [Chitinophagaceae bacterium]HNM35181.1 type II toxin-antitoxin system HicA family toxin [Chitinophagaceae bacterium]HNN31905.1 type II toxin-antitoxin system HicA family toxin [Chitinophagaceae bacterium]